ncbi:hypothetical protein B0H16DRAFT_1468857 [Mycena metata]|uniref:Uncharacterized protein n=1 Tax=Mycena metata TaxID=1033252 RepID=A0AAD7I0I1_9AGAR|nr:hypothetical protein B0H16DRAFT_1468857 [Mycena metata]
MQPAGGLGLRDATQMTGPATCQRPRLKGNTGRSTIHEGRFQPLEEGMHLKSVNLNVVQQLKINPEVTLRGFGGIRQRAIGKFPCHLKRAMLKTPQSWGHSNTQDVRSSRFFSSKYFTGRVSIVARYSINPRSIMIKPSPYYLLGLPLGPIISVGQADLTPKWLQVACQGVYGSQGLHLIPDEFCGDSTHNSVHTSAKANELKVLVTRFRLHLFPAAHRLPPASDLRSTSGSIEPTFLKLAVELKLNSDLPRLRPGMLQNLLIAHLPNPRNVSPDREVIVCGFGPREGQIENP